MRKIYKYELKVIPEQVVELPADFKILSVQLQGDRVCFWAIVEPEQETMWNVFNIAMTGEDFPLIESIHLATLQNNGIVIHIFHSGITLSPDNLN